MNPFMLDIPPDRPRLKGAKYTDPGFVPGWDIDNADFDDIMGKHHAGIGLTHAEQIRLGYYLGSLTKGAYGRSRQVGKAHCAIRDDDFADDLYAHMIEMMKYYDPAKGAHAYSFFYGAARYAVIKAGQDRRRRLDAEFRSRCLYDAALTTDLDGEIEAPDNIVSD